MCIAIIKPSGVPLPKEEVLERCFLINPDGAGYSTLSSNGKGFDIRKGFFNFSEYYKALKIAIKTDALAFIHMRIATCGYVDKKGRLWATAGQCHPFPITTDYSLMQRTKLDCVNEVFMHNGTINIDTEEHKGKGTSDTMTFNRMTAKGGLDPFNKGARMFIEVASDPCRLAYMRLINNVPCYTTVGEWEESEGCLYSNDGYKRRLVPEAEQLSYSTNNYIYNRNNVSCIWGRNVGYLTRRYVLCVVWRMSYLSESLKG